MMFSSIEQLSSYYQPQSAAALPLPLESESQMLLVNSGQERGV